MHEIYIFMLFSFLAPIAIFCLFWILKKPFLSIVVWLPLLLYHIIKTLLSCFKYSGFDNFVEKLYLFIHSDAVIIVPFAWIPSVFGFTLINLIYFVVKKIKNK